jgi:hypothetical protein
MLPSKMIKSRRPGEEQGIPIEEFKKHVRERVDYKEIREWVSMLMTN